MNRNYRKYIPILAAGLVCAQAIGPVAGCGLLPGVMTAMADELLVEENEDQGQEFFEEKPAGSEEVPETQAPQEYDDAPLLEDSDDESISIREGDSLDEVLEEEAREQALLEAQEKLQALLNEELWMPELPGEEKLAEYLEELTRMDSPTGSDGEILLSRYLRGVLEGFGYTVSEQSFHEGFLNEDLVDVPGINLIAERGADSEERTKQILLLCAHYDSKTSPEETDPLANDKSAAAALLETARLLASAESDVDVCFLFLSGEEDGSYGAQAFVENLSDDLKSRICGVIVVDQIGYVFSENTEASESVDNAGKEENRPSYVIATGDGETNVPAKMLQAAAESNMIIPISLGGLVEDPFAEDAFAETEEPAADTVDGGNAVDGVIAGEENSEETALSTVEGEDFALASIDSGAGKWFASAGFPVVTLLQDLEGEVTFPEKDMKQPDIEEETEPEYTSFGDAADAAQENETQAAEEAQAAEAAEAAEVTEAAEGEEPEYTSFSDAQPEAQQGEASQSHLVRVAQLQISELRWTTNIIAQTAALYMQSVQLD